MPLEPTPASRNSSTSKGSSGALSSSYANGMRGSVRCRSTDGALDTHERGIRARTYIVMRALRVLAQREREVPASALVGRFRCLNDVSRFLIDQVSQIYSLWMEQSGTGTGQQLDSSTRQALRYIAVDEAEVAFERLGRDVALATFLRVCAACDSDAVSTACREVAAIVGVQRTPNDDEHATDRPGPDKKCAS